MRRGSPRRIFRFMHAALTIAGSDSGGGAGIQADLRAFHHFGVWGTCAITAITAQNAAVVRSWEAVAPELVEAQIDSAVAGYSPTAFKTGMLGTAATARAVVAAIRRNALENYVLDPVMFASSGARLLDDDAFAILRDELLPTAALVTPNVMEAAALTSGEIRNTEDAARAAEALVRSFGAKAALVTGGHIAGGDVVDILFTDHVELFRAPRLEAPDLHGTGCTLSAGITAGLASGISLDESVRAAIDYVRARLEKRN